MKQLLILIKLSIISVIIFSGCSMQDNNMINSVQKHMQEYDLRFGDSLQTCFIIPGSGCPGCIASGIQFIRQNQRYFSKKQSDNMVVFTHVGAKKLLRRELSDLEITDLNCIIDTNSKYFIDFPQNKYPIILYLSKGKLIKVDYQSPDNDGTEKYLNYLTTHKL